MGDDRHGRAPGPGGRAPWERYPAADTEHDGARTGRRSRHADAAADAGGAPLTVQDLVEKVDSERVGRRRRRAEAPPSRPLDATPRAAATPTRPADPVPQRRAPEPTRRADEQPRGRRAPESDPPEHARTRRASDPAEHARTRRAPESVDPRRAPASPGPDKRTRAHRAPESVDPRRAPEGLDERARTPHESIDPRRAPESLAPDESTRSRRSPNANRSPDAAGPESVHRAPASPGPDDARTRRAPEAAPRRAEKARKNAPRRAASPVVDDITGAAPAPRRLDAEPAEAVTDIIPPVVEPDDEPAEKRTTETGWPTTETVEAKPSSGKAAPKPVGTQPLSRLAAAKQRRSRRLRAMGRSTAAVFAVLALLITGGGWSYLRTTGNSFTQVSAVDGSTEDVVDSAAQLGDENYLIVGTDTRAGVNGQMGAGTLADAEGARADTVMLVHIPQNRQRVVAVSFPRDLDVTRPKCERWDNDEGDYTGEMYPSAMGDKLNAVYALGGPRCLVDVIRKMTGLQIGHFIGIDFAGFEAMVNTIGGVEVCANKPIEDSVLGTVIANTGRQRVDGQTALNYVRARHVYGEERSDYDRINRQQRFLASLLRESLSSRVLFDPGRLNRFINDFTNHTWVDKVTPQDLLTLGRSLQKVDAGAVTFLTVPTAGTTSYGNEIPRETDIKAIFKAIRDDQPLPGEKPPAAPDPATTTSAPPAPPTYIAVDPSTVSVQVSNGAGVTGLAGVAATRLSNQGFQIYTTGNYAEGASATTKIRYASGHEAEAATVASAIPGVTLEVADELGSIIDVVVGADSATGLVVNAPTPVGDTITDVPATSAPDTTPVTLPSDLEHVNAGEDLCD
ncbi:LCP family protein [Nocardia puris]|uniref:LytR family transcriptional attenuator n=2 Tax=Nocardia puris TaxID=208602 RepID=A0A366DA63_9NOCA|nr:LCP family protein [Nocardia puris]RBO86952.1 LytR family transcriptional attenuator [Nocardia puris]